MHIHVSYMYIDVHIQRESADTYQDHIHQGQTCIPKSKTPGKLSNKPDE